jgi:hypothetical protein
MPFTFSHLEYDDTIPFRDFATTVVVKDYRRRFLNRNTQSKEEFANIHGTLRETGSLPRILHEQSRNGRKCWQM